MGAVCSGGDGGTAVVPAPAPPPGGTPVTAVKAQLVREAGSRALVSEAGEVTGPRSPTTPPTGLGGVAPAVPLTGPSTHGGSPSVASPLASRSSTGAVPVAPLPNGGLAAGGYARKGSGTEAARGGAGGELFAASSIQQLRRPSDRDRAAATAAAARASAHNLGALAGLDDETTSGTGSGAAMTILDLHTMGVQQRAQYALTYAEQQGRTAGGTVISMAEGAPTAAVRRASAAKLATPRASAAASGSYTGSVSDSGSDSGGSEGDGGSMYPMPTLPSCRGSPSSRAGSGYHYGSDASDY